jgi:hypothetical protein
MKKILGALVCLVFGWFAHKFAVEVSITDRLRSTFESKPETYEEVQPVYIGEALRIVDNEFHRNYSPHQSFTSSNR